MPTDTKFQVLSVHRDTHAKVKELAKLIAKQQDLTVCSLAMAARIAINEALKKRKSKLGHE